MLVHGDNISSKEASKKKYSDEESQGYLVEIRPVYDEWHQENINLVGPAIETTDKDKKIVFKRVELLEDYKNFIDQQYFAEKFDSRSNLHSSVIEEFMYYLFKDLVSGFGDQALVGKSHAFKDIFFVPENYENMIKAPNILIEKKDHDFVIGVRMKISAVIENGQDSPVKEEHQFDIPAVAIECKTYLDKNMLEGASRAAEELKSKNPNGMYIIVMEWIKLTDAVNLRKYKVDQIYVLRKDKNTDREFRYADDYVKNPIDPNVVWHLFETVRKHLTMDWEKGLKDGIDRGWLI